MKTGRMKELMEEYSEDIERIIAGLKKDIAGGTDIGSMSRDEITDMVLDRLFDDDAFDGAGVLEMDGICKAITSRIVNKYGILDDLLNDSEINEIMINGPGHIFIEKRRQILEVENAFTSENELEETIRMLASDVHREINEANPIVDARLPSGYRVSGVLKTVALNGPILTIRKFSEKTITMEDLIRCGSITEECATQLAGWVKQGFNIFISGGTSSGKTTFLEALAASIGRSERVVIIEDSAELKLDSIRNKVHMECRNSNSIGKGEVTMAMLIKTSLRMRPDRIIVGEVRGKEVVDMIQAMNTGHSGSMSTGHGNSIKGMLNRLETMYLMGGQTPLYSVRSQIANAIDVFVHLTRTRTGERRVVEIAELVDYDGNDYNLNYLYRIDEAGRLVRTKNEFDINRRML